MNTLRPAIESIDSDGMHATRTQVSSARLAAFDRCDRESDKRSEIKTSPRHVRNCRGLVVVVDSVGAFGAVGRRSCKHRHAAIMLRTECEGHDLLTWTRIGVLVEP